MKDAFLTQLLNGKHEVDKISKEIGLSLGQGMSIVRQLEILRPEWITVHRTEEGGAIVVLNSESRDNIEEFLAHGGFAKQEYDKPVQDQEILLFLREIYDSRDKELLLDDIERSKSFNRRVKLIDLLSAKGYLQKGSVTKMYTAYKLSNSGINAALTESLETIQDTTKADSPISPNVVYNTTTINQNISGAGHSAQILTAGDDSTIKTKKESESVWDKILGWITAIFK